MVALWWELHQGAAVQLTDSLVKTGPRPKSSAAVKISRHASESFSILTDEWNLRARKLLIHIKDKLATCTSPTLPTQIEYTSLDILISSLPLTHTHLTYTHTGYWERIYSLASIILPHYKKREIYLLTKSAWVMHAEYPSFLWRITSTMLASFIWDVTSAVSNWPGTAPWLGRMHLREDRYCLIMMTLV